jgi:hypothetical protein
MRGFAARQYANAPLTNAQRRGRRAVLAGQYTLDRFPCPVIELSIRDALREECSISW